MAQLYFKFGAMGSSKTANALMARFNYEERGQETLMVKPRLDTRDGDHMVSSRIGLTHPCIYFDEMRAMADQELQKYACIIIDEAQFLTKDEVFYLVHLVDDCGIPVLCYGLKVDFRGQLFEGSYYLLAMADKLEEVKTICWCALTQCQSARAKTGLRTQQIEALERAVESTELLMQHGSTTYLEVLTAQQSLLSAQLNQIADRFDEIQGIVNLYQALGGGRDIAAEAK